MHIAVNTAIKKEKSRFPAIRKVSFLVFNMLKRVIVITEVEEVRENVSAIKKAMQHPIEILKVLI